MWAMRRLLGVTMALAIVRTTYAYASDDIDNCAGVNCGNGYCVDGINSYSCSCRAGYTGSQCTDVDHCAGISCSGANGECVNLATTHYCHCVPGFTGPNCADVDRCDPDPCGNGVCANLPNDYYCVCLEGFTGKTCGDAIAVDNCAGVNCGNGGVCVDKGSAHVCKCMAGFTGSNCQVNINDCAGVTCSGNGVCRDGVNQYTCVCNTGFTGSTCNVNINDCAGVTCSGNGVCRDGVNQYTCVCNSGFTGSTCNVNINDCAGVTCSGNGVCRDGVNQHTCVCNPGFTGSTCSVNINDCAGVTCSGNGVCRDGVNQHTCVCNPGFTGSTCSVNINDCAGVTCSGNGVCRDGVTQYTCVCNTGFTGSTCNVNINDCAGVTCSGNGVCRDGVNQYTCVCNSGFTGSTCSVNINDCAGVTCSSNGVCRDGVNQHTCVCNTGFTGSTCNVKVDNCAGVNCGNGGVCVDQGSTYVCNCRAGFTGTNCQVNIDDCAGVDCGGGRCVDGVNEYTCTCDLGFKGPQCVAKDCYTLYASGYTKSGVYPLNPDGQGKFYAYCDLDPHRNDGTRLPGWTVLQRRIDRSVDFNRKYRVYENGFGELSGNFWLGLKAIHRLTSSAPVSLHIELEDFHGKKTYATYSSFSVSDQSDKYRLRISGHSGTAPERLFHSNNQRFSTKDIDNDGWKYGSCAKAYSSGWWFNSCFRANLNGVHGNDNKGGVCIGLYDDHWRRYTCYKRVTMKIQPANPKSPSATPAVLGKGRDCEALSSSGYTRSGLYTVNPDGHGDFSVFCDMNPKRTDGTSGAGWALIQRRVDGSINFNRKWNDYENGFGDNDIHGSFWLGLKMIHRLTDNGPVELHVELEDFHGKKTYAQYSSFHVSDRWDKYRLRIAGHSGTAPERLIYSNNQRFSTFDNDNDDNSHKSCAKIWDSGWWFNSCFRANLNGVHGNDNGGRCIGLYDDHWRRYTCYKRVTMKIRPRQISPRHIW